ncbi:MAG: tRNA (guanine(46)-N(7))-methyltransferase TrmB [Planctomycetota bacterium]
MRDQAAGLQPGDIEQELGVPLAGVILPPEQWAKTAIKRLPAPAPYDWTELFGRTAPVVLDLGCGNGRFLVASAVRRPDHDHVGLDALPLVIRYATRRANQRGLHNARLLVCSAHEFLESYVGDHSVQEVHIYHPQPYAEPGQAERRLLTPRFLTHVHRVLRPGGLLYLQTDNAGYWNYLQSVLPSFFQLQIREEPWSEDPDGRTRREIQARQQGLPIFRTLARPLELTYAELEKLAGELPIPLFNATLPGTSSHQQQARRRSPNRHRRSRRWRS